MKKSQLQAELPFDSWFGMSWIWNLAWRWADHALVTEGGQLAPGRTLSDTAGSVYPRLESHSWASLAVLRVFTWGNALLLGTEWEVGGWVRICIFLFSQRHPLEYQISPILNSAGCIEEETDRDPGSGVFVLNLGALGTSQVLWEPSSNRNNSILILDPSL